jgi:hypothetical protein
LRRAAPDHVDLIETLVGLASVRKEQGRDAEALALYERALAIKERAFTADHPELVEIRSNLDALRAATTGGALRTSVGPESGAKGYCGFPI